MRRAGKTLVLLAVPALSLALAAPAAARERTDLLLLARGDRVTCEIIRLESANLSLRTRNLGTVDVDWPDVVGLVSTQFFEVERADGVRLIGTLDVSEPPGMLVVRAGVDEATAIPMAEVVGIDQLDARLWRSRRGYLDLGWSFAQADRDTAFSLGAEMVLHGRRARWRNALSATITDDDASERTERHYAESSVEIPAGRHFLGMGWATWERNDDLGLDARTTVGGVAAWVPVHGAKGRVVIGPGLAESDEHYASPSEESVVTSGVFLVSGDYHRFGRYGTRASLAALWFPVLSGPSRHRIEVRAGLRQKMGSDFTFSVTPYYSYDSRPPAASAATEDWGWVTSIGWQF